MKVKIEVEVSDQTHCICGAPLLPMDQGGLVSIIVPSVLSLTRRFCPNPSCIEAGIKSLAFSLATPAPRKDQRHGQN